MCYLFIYFYQYIKTCYLLQNCSSQHTLSLRKHFQTWARDWCASASSAATVATPFNTVAAFSHIGVRAWQCPHHGAKNSTRTIPFEFRTCHQQHGFILLSIRNARMYTYFKIINYDYNTQLNFFLIGKHNLIKIIRNLTK